MRSRDRIIDLFLRLSVLTAAVLLPGVFFLKAYEVFNDTKSLALKIFGLLVGVALCARGGTLRTRTLPAGVAFLAACTISTMHTPLLKASLERLGELASFVVLLLAVEAGAVGLGKLLAVALWAHGLVIVYATCQFFGYDVIQWTQFGIRRVYATMGNCDFLAAHSSFLIPIQIGLVLGLSTSPPLVALRNWGRTLTERGWGALLGPVLSQTGRTVFLGLGLVCGLPAALVALFSAFHPLDDADRQTALYLIGGAGAILFALSLALRVTRRDARNLCILALILSVPSLVYTQARGALIGFVAGFLALEWMTLRRIAGVERLKAAGWMAILTAVQIPVVVGVLMLHESGRAFIDRFLELKNPVAAATLQQRLAYWYAGWLMGRGEPTAPGRNDVLLPVGAGIGAFHLAGARAQGRAQQIWDVKWPRAAEVVSPHLELYAHNDYVQLFAEIGPIGLGIYLWIAVVLLIAGFQALARCPPGDDRTRWMLMALMAATVSWYVNSLLNFPFKVVPNAHLFFAVIAAVLAAKTALPVMEVPFRVPVAATALLAAGALFLATRMTARQAASEYLKYGHQLTQAAQNGQANYGAMALGYFDRAARLSPVHTDGILVHYYRGMANKAANRFEDADADFTSAIGVFVNFPEGYMQRGLTRFLKASSLLTPPVRGIGVSEAAKVEAGRWLDGAVADLRESAYLNSKEPVTWWYLGNACRLQMHFAEAASAFAESVRFSQDRIPDAYFALAVTQIELGRLAEARATLEAAVAKFPATAIPPTAKSMLASLKAGRKPTLPH
ncbi:MAG: O-antigen ligase family protein [Candidatus Coatesbacteria bacterium]